MVLKSVEKLYIDFLNKVESVNEYDFFQRPKWNILTKLNKFFQHKICQKQT